MEVLHRHRFGLYLLSLILVLFTPLVGLTGAWQDNLISLFYLFNFFAGLLLARSYPRASIALKLLLALVILLEVGRHSVGLGDTLLLILLAVNVLFYGIVAYLIIHQEWRAEIVDQSVILGLMAGYISLGHVAFCLFQSIEYFQPGSISGLPQGDVFSDQESGILYFAFITLMTIGYGDLLPVTPLAQRASMLVGLAGQFYLVILTAVIVGKFLQQDSSSTEE